MSERTLVISDIHGCYDEFIKLLSISEYNPKKDKLILLGDYCDRGIKSKNVIEQIKLLTEEWGVIALRGNHEQMFLDAMLKDEDGIWLNNGGYQTMESYCGFDFFEELFEWDDYEEGKQFILKKYKYHLDFLNSLPLYHEADDFLFVHAGVNPMYENWKEQPDNEFIWITDFFISNPTRLDKTVIFGHTPTITIKGSENEDVWFGEDKIGIDGGCCFGYQLNCLEISDEGYKQYSVAKGDIY